MRYLGTGQCGQAIKVVAGDRDSTVIRTAGRIKLTTHHRVIALSGIRIAGRIGYTTYHWGLGIKHRHREAAVV